MASPLRAFTVTGFALGVLIASPVAPQRNAAVWERALQEKPRFLDTLKELVSIESGSSDPAGLSRIADLIAARLHGLGGEVRQVAPPADMVRFQNTPAQLGKSVVAQFRGSGAKTILLLAHMDTVYRPGMLVSNRSASRATAPTGWALPTTNRVSRLSCTRCRWSRPCRRGLV
jgi:hypothetical protein